MNFTPTTYTLEYNISIVYNIRISIVFYGVVSPLLILFKGGGVSEAGGKHLTVQIFVVGAFHVYVRKIPVHVLYPRMLLYINSMPYKLI